jgi:UDP-N-acetylmuramate--alanine ligase
LWSPALPPALAGDHNLRNLTGAVAAANLCGVPVDVAVNALAVFRGTGRRFETLGAFNGATLISDYGHHPTAIRANLSAARAAHPGARLWAVWQPHTFTRTRLLLAEFARAFAAADRVLVMDIYAAREARAEGDPDGPALAEAIRAQGLHAHARASGGLAATADLLRAEAGPDDVVIVFSAGDAPDMARLLLPA